MGKFDFAKKFTITVDALDEFHWSKTFYGTESAAAVEAMDFMNQKVLEYIQDNNITDPEEQERIVDLTTHTISWDDSEHILCYALLDNGCPLGVYYDLVDAEEMAFTYCDEAVYEMMMDSDPMDMFGKEEFDYCRDYWYLMQDTADDFIIAVVPVWGLEERYD